MHLEKAPSERYIWWSTGNINFAPLGPSWEVIFFLEIFRPVGTLHWNKKYRNYQLFGPTFCLKVRRLSITTIIICTWNSKFQILKTQIPILEFLVLGRWKNACFSPVIFDLSRVNEALESYKTKTVQGIGFSIQSILIPLGMK